MARTSALQKQRNELIKADYYELKKPHIMKGWVYEQLAQKYFLTPAIIGKIVKETSEQTNTVNNQ